MSDLKKCPGCRGDAPPVGIAGVVDSRGRRWHADCVIVALDAVPSVRGRSRQPSIARERAPRTVVAVSVKLKAPPRSLYLPLPGVSPVRVELPQGQPPQLTLALGGG